MNNFPNFSPPLKSDLVLPFYAGLEDGELRLPVCSECRKTEWYPTRILPCHPDADLEWRKVSSVGTVYSFSLVERSLLPGAKVDSVPHMVVLVEPNDAQGHRIVGLMADADAQLACGDLVRFKPTRIFGRVLPVFVKEPIQAVAERSGQ